MESILLLQPYKKALFPRALFPVQRGKAKKTIGVCVETRSPMAL